MPPALERAQQAALKRGGAGVARQLRHELANWNWKVVCQYVSERFGISLSRSTCLNYLRRLDSPSKRPKKRLLKADVEKREVFVAEYARPVGRGAVVWGQDILR